MRRASTLLLQLKHRGKETRSELLLGATVTDGGLGYRSVTQALHNHVETNAAAFESCGGPWASFFPQGTLRSSDKSLKSSVLGRDSQCNASQCNDSQCNTLSALPPGDATVNSNSLLHHSAIARSPPLETPFSSSVSLANPSATFPGAALKPPLQRSGFGIQQSVSTRKQWGQERHCSWCGQEGRGYSSGAINLAGGEHRYEDTMTVQSTEHEKRCGMCLKVRRLREFQPQRSSPDGYHYWCRGCSGQLSRARRGLAAGVVRGQAHCPCCDEVKDRALFGLEPRNRSGLQKICRACVAEDYQTRPNVAGRTEKKWSVWAGAERPVVITLRRREGLWVPTEKVCLSCGELKGSEEYFADPSKTDGLRQYCKCCFTKKQSRHPANRKSKPANVHPELEEPVQMSSQMMTEVRAAFRWLVGDESEMPRAAQKWSEDQKRLQSASNGAD